MLGKKSKKGSVLDIAILLPVVLFILGVTVFIAWLAISEVSDEFAADEDFSANGNATAMVEYGKQGISVFDYGLLFIIIAMVIGAIASAFMIKTHPVFAVVFLIVIFISSVVTAYFANTFEELSTDAVFSTSLTQFPVIFYIMTHLPWIVGLLSFLVMIITFAKED